MIITHKKFNKPSLQLQVMRVESGIWSLFKKHHYMSEELNKSCKCLVFMYNDVPVAFVGIINQPGKGRPWGYRISRMVILPDFQGFGLARKILDFCGGIIKSTNPQAELYMKTIHDNMGRMLERNKNWNPTSFNGKERKKRNDEGTKYQHRLLRKSYCYRYDGEPIYGYEDLLLPINVLRERKSLSL